MRPLVYIGLFLFPLLFFGCGTPQSVQGSSAAHAPTSRKQQVDGEWTFPKKAVINLVVAPIKPIPMNASDFGHPRTPLHLKPESPVARQIVESYYKSSEKTPGGHCLEVSKRRFKQAYEDVHGHPFYRDLSQKIATEQLTPSEVFDHLFDTATKQDPEWQNLPRKYRAKGSAGAIALAGLGDLVDTEDIWNGKLRPGALVQVWRLRKDYERVRNGSRILDFDPYGHSFVFLGYELDERGVIQGLKIADQGYQSYRSLVPRDYEVWWGVNLKI